ncbi:fibronectin type 3 and ankyrin repeat domains 1 protein [Salminus brasiliensis]|uniref:fibronectin type 3 and ankyrin repeat domains 1 protein n=1 Tax=Salminus brasiliensis TaxID=930266 RepID=UPI003B834978
MAHTRRARARARARAFSPPDHKGVSLLSVRPVSRSRALFSSLAGTGESTPGETLIVGQVSHHSIELSWTGDERERRQGPPDNWTCFRLEVEDPRRRGFHEIYVGFHARFTVEDLEPSTAYKFRLKSLSPSGEHLYSPVLTVSTAREPINGKDLHQAVKMNDEEQLLRVLQSGGTVVVDVPDRLGFTPLMVAAMKGFISLVQVLVQHGADVNFKNSSGKDSLMLACFSGHLEVVRYLRESGGTWTATDRGGCCALHWAADGGHLPVLEYLLKDGCEVDARDSVSSWTPLLRVSAVTGDTAVAALLISAGADINVRDKDGKTPLMVAVLNNHEKLVKLLLENGVDQHIRNEFGAGALEMAKAFERKNIIPLLENERPVAGAARNGQTSPREKKQSTTH